MTYERDPNFAGLSGAWGLLQRVYQTRALELLKAVRYWRENLFG